MSKYKVIAIDNLDTSDGHSWTKGLDYEVIEKGGYFTLSSNEGQLNYKSVIKDAVMINFDLM